MATWICLRPNFYRTSSVVHKGLLRHIGASASSDDVRVEEEQSARALIRKSTTGWQLEKTKMWSVRIEWVESATSRVHRVHREANTVSWMWSGCVPSTMRWSVRASFPAKSPVSVHKICHAIGFETSLVFLECTWEVRRLVGALCSKRAWTDARLVASQNASAASPSAA
jgi:hypothetical protein